MTPLAAVGPGAALGMCRNEETFRDFIPVEEVAKSGDLFISESGHGMGCDELVTWLLTKRAWINPLSSAAFTPEDIAAIRAWKRPEIKRLQDLDDAAAAHVLSAWDAQALGNAESYSEHMAQAATLAPDRAAAHREQWAALCAQRAASGQVGPAPPPARRSWRGLFGGRRASETLPAVAPAVPPPLASAASMPAVLAPGAAGVAGGASAAAPAMLSLAPAIAPATRDALQRLADVLARDTSTDLMPSLLALIDWQAYADSLAPDALARIDAQVRIFDRPFSEQCRAVVDPHHHVDGRRCGATDLGRELHKALRICP